MPIFDTSSRRLQAVLQAVEDEDRGALTAALESLHPADAAHLLESLPATARSEVWSLLSDEARGEALVEMRDEVREYLIEETTPQDLVAAVQELDAEDIAHILDEVPPETVSDILDSMDQQDRARLEQNLAYPEDSAGRLLDPEVVTVRADVSVDVVLRYLRRHESLPEHTDSLLVIDKENTFIGSLALTRLLTAQPQQSVGELTDIGVDRVFAETSVHDVATLFERHDLLSLAVVDKGGKLLGRITIDDVVDIIHEEAEQPLLNMAGLDQDDDLFAPVLASARRRALWLGLNLATAFLAAWVIGLFEATLEKVVALAVLMPIVASMGGIAGSQVLTLAVRAIALDQLSPANARWLALKELAVGALNGLVWAVVVGLIAALWFHDWRIAGVIGVAMLVNLLAAAFAGVAVPLALQRLNLDPALSGSVILTTITDVVGFVCFLGLGTLFLL